MLKKTLTLFLALGFSINLWSPIQIALSQDNTPKVKIEVLERAGCQHCEDQREFLDDLLEERDDIEVTYYPITEPENKELWRQLTDLEKIPKVTPITLIGDTIIQGFATARSTGVMIEELIDNTKGKLSKTIPEFIAAGGSGKVQAIEGGGCNEETGVCDALPYEALLVEIPFFGSVDIKQYSLPVLSIVLGFIDGFNPCAMWVLVTFLVVLVQVGNKRRMWEIAGLFILAEAIMYYLILNVWYSTWDFIGLDNIITPIVGIVAIGGGLFFLWEWYQSGATCKVTNIQQRQKTRSRVQRLATAEMSIVTVLGIIGLALSVNIIEFACSIGIPQAFTKILDINILSFAYRQLYMGLYILFYMVDDLIIFGIALYSIEKIGLTTKYIKFSNLIGGILMILLGLLLILAPSILVF